FSLNDAMIAQMHKHMMIALILAIFVVLAEFALTLSSPFTEQTYQFVLECLAALFICGIGVFGLIKKNSIVILVAIIGVLAYALYALVMTTIAFYWLSKLMGSKKLVEESNSKGKDILADQMKKDLGALWAWLIIRCLIFVVNAVLVFFYFMSRKAIFTSSIDNYLNGKDGSGSVSAATPGSAHTPGSVKTTETNREN
ncbi:hypothetical protein PMAYCL1PPCAC_28493, partial [Pristionchus mayeri]